MAKKKKEATVVDVLRRMKALLRKGWTQGVCARGKSGREVDYDSRSAVSFCIYGAEHKATGDLNAISLGIEAESFIASCISNVSGQRRILYYNDAPGRKKSEVIAVVNCAIKKAASA